MARSVYTRVWDAVKPPPSATAPGSANKKLTAKQKRLLYATLAVVVLGVIAWPVYAFIASARQRADKEYQAGMKLLGPGKYRDANLHFTRAIEIRPGAKSLVHHANLYVDRARSAREGPGMDPIIERTAFDPDDGHFLFWKPGATPTEEAIAPPPPPPPTSA